MPSERRKTSARMTIQIRQDEAKNEARACRARRAIQPWDFWDFSPRSSRQMSGLPAGIPGETSGTVLVGEDVALDRRAHTRESPRYRERQYDDAAQEEQRSPHFAVLPLDGPVPDLFSLSRSVGLSVAPRISAGHDYQPRTRTSIAISSCRADSRHEALDLRSVTRGTITASAPLSLFLFLSLSLEFTSREERNRETRARSHSACSAPRPLNNVRGTRRRTPIYILPLARFAGVSRSTAITSE